MSTFLRFEDIEAWQKARELTKSIYEISKRGKFATDFAFRDQIRRSSVSIMANIAEGHERGGNKEFVQFLSVAKGSVGEVRSHLYVALDQDYITKAEFEGVSASAVEIGRMIAGLITYLRKTKIKGAKFRDS